MIASRHVIAIVVVLLGLLVAAPAGATPDDDPARDLEKYSGQPVTAIKFSGLKRTKTYVVEREVRSETGKPLDPQLVKEDVLRLENRQIFGVVTVNVTPTDQGDALEFELEEIPWIIQHPSLKYTEENSFSIGAGVSSPNFLGRAMTLSAGVLFGGQNTFNASFQDPWITGNHVSAGGKFGHNVRQNELLDFEETTDLFQLAGGTYLGDQGRLSANAGYLGVQSDQDSITLNPDNHDRMYFGSVILGQDSRDSWTVPRNGWKNQWINVSYVGGDADFWTFQFDMNRYLPIGKHQAIAFGPLFSYQTGTVNVDVPQYLQYFMGGANTIRGYKLLDLGKELFGKNQLIVNVEYRWDFFPMRGFQILKWEVSAGLQLAGFADAGIAWSESRDFSLDRARFGFGAGVRLMLPVLETIRFDVGVSQYGDVVFNFGVHSIFHGRLLRVR